MFVNHHISCPDPSLTLGIPEHRDPNLTSMLQQCSVPRLQVFLKGKWIDVEPLPIAFLVIPGLQLKAPPEAITETELFACFLFGK